MQRFHSSLGFASANGVGWRAALLGRGTAASGNSDWVRRARHVSVSRRRHSPRLPTTRGRAISLRMALPPVATLPHYAWLLSDSVALEVGPVHIENAATILLLGSIGAGVVVSMMVIFVISRQ